MTSPDLSLDLDVKSQKILDVARMFFLEKGFAGTSMDDVAKYAHMSKTTLYRRYPSKESLFAAVISNLTDRSGMNLDIAALVNLPIEDALFEIGMRFFDFICQPDSLRMELVYFSEGASIPEAAAAFERSGPNRVIEIVKRFFRSAVRKHILTMVDPHFVTVQFLIAIKGDPNGLTFQQLDNASKAEKEARIRRITQLFLNGIRPR